MKRNQLVVVILMCLQIYHQHLVVTHILSNNEFVTLVVDICSYYGHRESIVVISDLEEDSISFLYNFVRKLEYPVLVYVPSLHVNNAMSRNHKIGRRFTVVLVLTSVKSLIRTMEFAQTLPVWNPQEKIIVVTTSSTSDSSKLNFHRILWRERVLNSVIVSQKCCQLLSNEHEYVEDRNCCCVVVSTYFPFEDNFITIKLCDNKNLNTMTEYTDKMKNQLINMNGYPIPISGFNLMPYSERRYEENKVEYFGYAGKMLEELVRRVNFTPNFVKQYSTVNFGYELPNGSWTGVMRDVVVGEAELSFNVFLMIISEFDIVDFTFPLSIDSLHFLAPKSHCLPQWRSILLPFRICLWPAIVSSALVVWISFRGVETISRRLRKSQLPKHNFFYILSILVRISVQQPEPLEFRFIFLSWAFSSLIFSSAYEGSLVGFLTTPTFYPEIKTFQDIAESDLKITSDPSIMHFLQKSSTRPLQQLYKNYEPVTSYNDAIHEVAFKRKSLFYSTRELLVYQSRSNVSLKDGQLPVHIVEESFGTFCLSYIMSKNSPYLPRINGIISRAAEAGFLGKWVDDTISNGYALGDLLQENTILSLSHLQAPFYLFIVGHTLSLIVVAIEMILYKLSLW